LIGKGFGVWRRNLNLCIPILLSIFVSILILLPLIVAFSITSHEKDNILQTAVFFLAMVALLVLVDAFFTAGAIGMARQALEKGKSDTGAMWPAGKRHFFNMFQATLLMGLLAMAGLIFLLPALAQGSQLSQADLQMTGLMAAGLLLFILYVLALSVILVAVPYVLVLEDLGPVQAILAAIRFFRYNKFDVVVLWLVVSALSMGLQMIGGAFSTGEGAGGEPLSLITGIVSLLVLAPLSNLWWTRLYMNRKGILIVDEVLDPW
jgi:hypothetical protein